MSTPAVGRSSPRRAESGRAGTTSTNPTITLQVGRSPPRRMDRESDETGVGSTTAPVGEQSPEDEYSIEEYSRPFGPTEVHGVLHTFIFTGEDPSLGNRLAVILIGDSGVLFASCQLLTSSPQTPKFRLEIQLLSGAGTEAEQRETVHERITDALEVLVQQMGPPAHRFHGKWLDYIWDQEDDSDAAIEDDSDMATEDDSDAATVSSTGSMDSDALMALENSLFGYPPDRGLRDPDMLEVADVNPADVLPELGSLFSPGGSLVLTETHGNVARPGIHYDRYLNYEDSDEDEEDDDDNDSDDDDDDDDD